MNKSATSHYTYCTLVCSHIYYTMHCTCLVNISRTFYNVAINMKEKHLSNRREKNPKIYQCCITFYGWNLEHVFLNIILPSLKVVRILNEHSVRNSLLQVLCGLTSVTYYTHIDYYPMV